MAEVAEEKIAVPVPTGVPLKLVIIIVVATLVVGLGAAFVLLRMTTGSKPAEESHAEAPAAAAAAAGHGEAPAKKAAGAEPGIMADLDPFIVNLADAPEIRYLKLNLKLELDRADAAEEIKLRTPQIRDSVLVLLTSKDSSGVRSPQGKSQLRDEITQRINALLPRPAVRSAYFTEFVIQ